VRKRSRACKSDLPVRSNCICAPRRLYRRRTRRGWLRSLARSAQVQPDAPDDEEKAAHFATPLRPQARRRPRAGHDPQAAAALAPRDGRELTCARSKPFGAEAPSCGWRPRAGRARLGRLGALLLSPRRLGAGHPLARSRTAGRRLRAGRGLRDPRPRRGGIARSRRPIATPVSAREEARVPRGVGPTPAGARVQETRFFLQTDRFSRRAESRAEFMHLKARPARLPAVLNQCSELSIGMQREDRVVPQEVVATEQRASGKIGAPSVRVSLHVRWLRDPAS
jgi:hypothetical protein